MSSGLISPKKERKTENVIHLWKQTIKQNKTPFKKRPKEVGIGPSRHLEHDWYKHRIAYYYVPFWVSRIPWAYVRVSGNPKRIRWHLWIVWICFPGPSRGLPTAMCTVMVIQQGPTSCVLADDDRPYKLPHFNVDLLTRHEWACDFAPPWPKSEGGSLNVLDI